MHTVVAEKVLIQRRARSTGTVVQLVKEPEADDDERWMTLCVDHGGCVFHDTRKDAEGWLSHPEDWCPYCQEKAADDGNDQLSSQVTSTMSKPTDIKMPTLHLNGSGYERLHALHVEAWNALRLAKDRLYDAAPHGRDFYVQGDDAFAEARRQHDDRVGRINSVLGEVEAILENLTEQENS